MKEVVVRKKRATHEDSAPVESTMVVTSGHGHARGDHEPDGEGKGEGQDERPLHVRPLLPATWTKCAPRFRCRQGITSGNAASIGLHARHAFRVVGVERRVALKRDRRLDVTVMQLLL